MAMASAANLGLTRYNIDQKGITMICARCCRDILRVKMETTDSGRKLVQMVIEGDGEFK